MTLVSGRFWIRLGSDQFHPVLQMDLLDVVSHGRALAPQKRAIDRFPVIHLHRGHVVKHLAKRGSPDDGYAPQDEGGLPYDDPKLGIEWPLPVGEMSPKDAAWRSFTEVEDELRRRMSQRDDA